MITLNIPFGLRLPIVCLQWKLLNSKEVGVDITLGIALTLMQFSVGGLKTLKTYLLLPAFLAMV